MIEIKQSTIPNSGRGVFATKFIAKGTKVTEYYGKKVTKELLKDEFLSGNLSVDAILNIDDYSIIGDTKHTKLSQCGQIINDYSRLEDKKYTCLSDLQEAVSQYVEDRILNHNVMPLLEDWNSPVFMYATRDIQPNEELFHSYGERFWIAKLTQISPNLRSTLNWSLDIENQCINANK